MTGTLHVFDFLGQPAETLPEGMAVIFGGERFLKRLALRRFIEIQAVDSDPEYAVAFLDADAIAWQDVHDELLTRSLFGGTSKKLVVIDHADKFVTAQREKLEAYLNPPKPKSKARKSKKDTALVESDEPSEPKSVKTGTFYGLLILIVDSWPATTRLFKEVDRIGLQVKCDAPLSGRSKNRDDRKIGQWLVERARLEYQLELSLAGAQTVIELTDCEFGRIDQELQKLMLYRETDGTLALDTIKLAVGGWQTKTTWEAIDAAADGNLGKALELLDRLLRNGEHPLALFGQIASSLRKYSTATEAVFRQLRSSQRPQMPAALKEAGFWGNDSLNEGRLKRIGSKRASQISQWLLEADLALKRSHSKEELGRFILETLLLRLAD
jgi:DNA polymerase-3 subunit delta